MDQPRPPSTIFATTHWSVVLAAGGADNPAALEAWEQLARACWPPLYAHARRRRHSPEDARDLVQGFFARLIEKSVLRHADRDRGRFRTFLLGAFDHFLANAHDHANALKRGGGIKQVSLFTEEGLLNLEDALEPAKAEEPSERRFDRDWAHAIVDRSLAALAVEFAREGKSAQFAVLRPFLFATPGPGEYAQAAAQLGLEPSLMPKAVARLRQRLRVLVRGRVAQTVSTVREIDEEMRYLVELIAEP